MNEIIEKELNIEDMIYEIRGKQVMLDRDLAKLYHVETKVFMQSIKRNIERFPINFMFQLNEQEFKTWRSQFVTSSGDKKGLRRAPYAFTEQGVAMLSSVLRSKTAINTSIKIIDTFVKMRHYIKNNMLSQQNINNIVLDDHTHILKMDGDLKLLQEAFDKLEDKKRNNEIFFNGQTYDSYSKILDIFTESKQELIVIDSYADKSLLDIIKKYKTNIILITKENNKLTKIDIDKYNSQYKNLKIIYNDTFHDRYIIVDKKTVYHCGTSINYIGTRTFSINLLSDEITKKLLLDKINKIIKTFN